MSRDFLFALMPDGIERRKGYGSDSTLPRLLRTLQIV
jgi:hypothetical protein